MPRLFIAFDVTPTPALLYLQKQLAEQLDLMMECAVPAVRIITQYHVTLLFFGQVLPDTLLVIQEATQKALAQFCRDYNITNGISEISLAPQLVLFNNAGAVLIKPHFLLSKLYEQLHTACRKNGITCAPHKSYIPHLTLIRIDQSYLIQKTNRERVNYMVSHFFDAYQDSLDFQKPFSIHELVLYQSQQGIYQIHTRFTITQ